MSHNDTAVEGKQPPIQGFNSSCEAKLFTVDSQVGTQAGRSLYHTGLSCLIPTFHFFFIRVLGFGGCVMCPTSKVMGTTLGVLILYSWTIPQMSYTVPIMAFAFVCHPEVLPIYTELCR